MLISIFKVKFPLFRVNFLILVLISTFSKGISFSVLIFHFQGEIPSFRVNFPYFGVNFHFFEGNFRFSVLIFHFQGKIPSFSC